MNKVVSVSILLKMSFFCLIKIVLLVLGLVRHGLSKIGEEARRHSSDGTS